MAAKTQQQQQPKKTEINLGAMNLYQLNALKQQLDQDLELLQHSLVGFSSAKMKFIGCSETVESFEKIANGNQLMVPLTPSLFVPGRTLNNDEFLLDIGTGYYIERDRKSTVDYFKRKVQFLNTQMDEIVKSIKEKGAFRQKCLQRQQQLIMAQMAQQQQQQTSPQGQPPQTALPSNDNESGTKEKKSDG